ncbi:MAG: hypothetical protein WC752_00645 [Patescibacteria group bacterium]|jgi:hypothetical protein
MKKKIKTDDLNKKCPLNKQIKIITDSYDDIFSDFDPRPFNVRELSEDFLRELKRASLQKDECGLLLTIMVPKAKRKIKEEDVIRKRIASYIGDNCKLIKRDIANFRIKGLIFLVIGLAMMMSASYIATLESKLIYIQFLFVLLEPTGWFTTWQGLEHLTDKIILKRKDLAFYRKMANCTIRFISY